MKADYRKKLDFASWTRKHWAVFSSTSLGFFVWGFVYSLPFIISSWPVVPPALAPYMFVISSSFLVLGNFFLGMLADRIGRKRTFILTTSLYALGLFGVAFSRSFITLMLSLALAEFGVGGEEPPSLAILAEYSPVRIREKVLILSSNFYNIGASVAAYLSLSSLSSFTAQRELFAIASAILLGLIIYTRKGMPESARWLAETGKYDDAQREVQGINVKEYAEVEEKDKRVYSAALAFSVAAVMGVTQLTTYGLLAFVVGPSYYPSMVSWLILVANSGASVAGLLAANIANKVSRRLFALLSFAGGFATVMAVFFAVNLISSFMLLFYVALFINMMFSEFAWAARVTLEPELFSTKIRASFISFIRLSAWVPYIIFIYITSSLSIYSFMQLNILLWGLGMLSCVVWYVRGVETKGKSLEDITKEGRVIA